MLRPVRLSVHSDDAVRGDFWNWLDHQMPFHHLEPELQRNFEHNKNVVAITLHIKDAFGARDVKYTLLERWGSMPEPICKLGYPEEQLREILGDQYDDFQKWMIGQTMAICEGRSFHHDTRKYEANGCGPHGLVVYRWDLERFMKGLPVID